MKRQRDARTKTEQSVYVGFPRQIEGEGETESNSEGECIGKGKSNSGCEWGAAGQLEIQRESDSYHTGGARKSSRAVLEYQGVEAVDSNDESIITNTQGAFR